MKLGQIIELWFIQKYRIFSIKIKFKVFNYFLFWREWTFLPFWSEIKFTAKIETKTWFFASQSYDCFLVVDRNFNDLKLCNVK